MDSEGKRCSFVGWERGRFLFLGWKTGRFPFGWATWKVSLWVGTSTPLQVTANSAAFCCPNFMQISSAFGCNAIPQCPVIPRDAVGRLSYMHACVTRWHCRTEFLLLRRESAAGRQKLGQSPCRWDGDPASWGALLAGCCKVKRTLSSTVGSSPL